VGVGAEVHRGGIVRKVEEKWVKCEVGWAEEEEAQAGRMDGRQHRMHHATSSKSQKKK